MPVQRSAGDFLDRAEDVGPLMPKARHLLELRQAVMQLLPESLSRFCTVANDRQGRLVIFAGSSVIAAKLKLLAPTLRNQLCEAGRQVTSVTIEVQPPAPGPQEKVHKPQHKPTISPTAAAEVSKLSERVSDPQMREVLRSLAGRARDPKR